MSEKQILEEIQQRDYWEEKATELAQEVGRLLGSDVGEHSNINCPVINAIELIKTKNTYMSK